jgi:hypothetical protein
VPARKARGCSGSAATAGFSAVCDVGVHGHHDAAGSRVIPTDLLRDLWRSRSLGILRAVPPSAQPRRGIPPVLSRCSASATRMSVACHSSRSGSFKCMWLGRLGGESGCASPSTRLWADPSIPG